MVTLDQAGAGAASVRLVPASGCLRSRVQHFWVETPDEASTGGPQACRIVADTCAHLLYHRVRSREGAGVAHRLMLVGPRTVAVDVDKRERLATAGVRLQPWSLPLAQPRARYAARLLADASACGDTASELGISSRRLRSVIREQVGLAPKTLARIFQLHGALERARAAGGKASWSRIAAACGYADQAHLIREFRDLIRETPGEWARRAAAR